MKLTEESIFVEIGGYSTTTIRLRDLKPEIKLQILENQEKLEKIKEYVTNEDLFLEHHEGFKILNDLKELLHTKHSMESVKHE